MQVKESKRIVVFTGAGAEAQPYYINSLPVSTELLVQISLLIKVQML